MDSNRPQSFNIIFRMVSNRRQVYAIAMVWSSQLNSILNWFVGWCPLLLLLLLCYILQWRNGCLGSHVSSSIKWYWNHWDYSHQFNPRFFANKNNNATISISIATFKWFNICTFVLKRYQSTQKKLCTAYTLCHLLYIDSIELFKRLCLVCEY